MNKYIFATMVFVTILLNSFSLFAYEPVIDPWSIPLYVTSATKVDTLWFGTKVGASNSFNSGIDKLAPPPPPQISELFPCFQISGIFKNLNEDYRSNIDSTNTWQLQISGTNNSPFQISWNNVGFPQGDVPGKLFINGTNMLQTSSLSLNGDQSLSIAYEAPKRQMANFTANPLTGIKPLTVQFTNSSTGNITSYLWNFGDTQTSSEQNPVHIYTNSGTFTVSLTVSGSGWNDKFTRNNYIQVSDSPQPLTANFTAAPLTGIKPLNVQFTNTSTGTITSWLWQFGDNATSTDVNPVHVYNTAGSFPVSLTVTGPQGSNTKTRQNYIVVTEPPPTANFIGAPRSGNAPLSVQFTDRIHWFDYLMAVDFWRQSDQFPAKPCSCL